MKTIKLILLLVCISDAGFSQVSVNCHKFPVPERTASRLFYLQRNLNANTIVYDANFDINGKLDSSEPVNVYWIRYEEKGNLMPLRQLEKKLAFGVKHEKDQTKDYDYKITLNAFNNRHIYLRQLGPYRVAAFTIINGKEIALDHIYVQAVEGYCYSRIAYIELYGIEHSANNQQYERLQF